MNAKQIKQTTKRFLPPRFRCWLESQWRNCPYQPPIGKVRFGDLRRLSPISREFGYDRGIPLDRYYIEKFLARWSHDIHGRVLEIEDAAYTKKYGQDRVSRSDVLHVADGNPDATIVADLTDASNIDSEIFDCVIITQTLNLIYDMKAVVATINRILKPGGVVLATVPGISQVVKHGWGDNWYWALTTQSAQLLFEGAFPKSQVEVTSYGNALVAIAFLQGLAVEDLSTEELDFQDNEYQVLLSVRAVKPL